MGILTKGFIGRQDQARWNGDTTYTFDRGTSTGSTKTLTKIGNEVDALMFGDGETYDWSVLNAAIQHCSDARTIVVAPGTWTINATLTIPSYITLKVPQGAIIDITGGTFTINGHLDAGPYQIFSTGSPVFGYQDTVYPEWWGAAPDNSTDCYAAIQSAVSSVDGTTAGGDGGTVKFRTGKYLVSDQLTSEGNVIICGAGMYSTQIISTQTDADCLFLFQKSSSVVRNIIFKDIYLKGNESNHTGGAIEFDSTYRVLIDRCYIYGFGGIGVQIYESETTYSQNTTIRDSIINYNALGGVKIGTTGLSYFVLISNCSINQNSYYGVYIEKGNNIHIENSEFAGYYYGNTPAGATHQSVPIAVNQVNSLIVESSGFENNGGTSGTAGYNMRFGYDGDAQANATNTARNLILLNNDFKGADGNDRDLNHIKFHYVKHATVQGNHFEHNDSYTGTYYAYEIGSNTSTAPFTFNTNEYDSTLDAIFDSVFSAYVQWLETTDVETITADAQTLQEFGVTVIDTTVGAIGGTLGDGNYYGEEKIIRMSTDNGDYTLSVTHHETSDPEVFTFDDAGDVLVLRWLGDWTTVKNIGVTV